MPTPPNKRMGLWAQVGFYSSLGMILPAGVVGGFGLGWWLDRRLHTSPLFALALSLVGAAAGIIEILRILTRSEKRDESDESNGGSGTG
jgi:F0F1-type ATP synthase assembly protein I